MFDTIIIGAGPAGMTSLLYATMFGLQGICIGDVIGGKLTLAPNIIDYPGITSITGSKFIEQLSEQLKINDATLIKDLVTTVVKTEEGARPIFKIETDQGHVYETRTIVFASGNGKKQKINHAQNLAQSLAIKTHDNLFQVNEQGITHVAGVFAAGDCVTYPRSVEQLATALATAIQATTGVYEYITGKKPPILWGKAKILRI